MLFPLRARRCLAVAAPLALAACTGLGTRQPAPLLNYQPESFDASAFSRHYAARPARICEAARRALLSQGYVVTAAAAEQVTARKYFQPDAQHHVQLEFRIVCAPEAGESASGMAFASGLEDQYMIRKVKDSASVGVGGIGSLSLPLDGGMDALVKVSSKTVLNRALYERLFDLVSAHLDDAVEPPPPQAATTPAPAPAPPPPQPTIILLQSSPPAQMPAAQTPLAPATEAPPPPGPPEPQPATPPPATPQQTGPQPTEPQPPEPQPPAAQPPAPPEPPQPATPDAGAPAEPAADPELPK
jgi:hypothetical protein